MLNLSLNRKNSFPIPIGLGRIGKIISGWNDPSLEIGDIYYENGIPYQYTGSGWTSQGGYGAYTGYRTPQPYSEVDKEYYQANILPGATTQQTLESFMNERLVEKQTLAMGGKLTAAEISFHSNDLVNQVGSFCSIRGDSPGCEAYGMIGAKYAKAFEDYVKQVQSFYAGNLQAGVQYQSTQQEQAPSELLNTSNSTPYVVPAPTSAPLQQQAQAQQAQITNITTQPISSSVKNTNRKHGTGYINPATIKFEKTSGSTGQGLISGDGWRLIITGDPGENVSITASKNGSSLGTTPFGSIASNGQKILSGVMTDNEIGTWIEDVKVGNRIAGTLNFVVGPKSSGGSVSTGNNTTTNTNGKGTTTEPGPANINLSDIWGNIVDTVDDLPGFPTEFDIKNPYIIGGLGLVGLIGLSMVFGHKRGRR